METHGSVRFTWALTPGTVVLVSLKERGKAPLIVKQVTFTRRVLSSKILRWRPTVQ